MLIDRPGLAHDALASVVDDVDGVVRLRPGGDQDDTVPPDVIVVDDRLLQSGSALAVMTGAQLIVVGVDDHPGSPRAPDGFGADWVAKEHAASLLPALLSGSRAERAAGPAPTVRPRPRGRDGSGSGLRDGCPRRAPR